jgi:hypothetical protein
MSLLHTHDGTVILRKDGHVISARTVEDALAELARRSGDRREAARAG